MRRLQRRILAGLAAIALSWAVAAYLVLPIGWRHFERQPGLAPKPMLTTTPQGIPGDPINVGLVGSRNEVVQAFTRAGWHPADPITVRSSIEIGLSVVLDRPYLDAPVSPLLYEGRRQDLAFERPVGRSARQRHHVRLWLALERGEEARAVWVGCASFDESVGFSRDTGQITHHIAPDLDAERDGLMRDLSAVGVVERLYWVSGIGPTLKGRNGGGDPYFTDGEVLFGVVTPDASALTDQILIEPAPLRSAARRQFWSALARFVHRPRSNDRAP